MAFRALFKALLGCFNLCVVILRLSLFVYKTGTVLEPTAINIAVFKEQLEIN